MKLIKNINVEILDLENKPIFVDNEKTKTGKVGDVLANCLITDRTDDPVRSLKIALDIKNATDEISFEDADFEMLIATIKNNKNISNLVAGRVLETLNASETTK